jgi:hypothetical protein
MIGRQLHLFRGRKQRGTAPPAPSECQLHCAVADTVRRWIMPGWIFTHIASGEKRDQVTAARLKRMGVMPGFPDLVFFGPHAEVCFVELKGRDGRLGQAQADIAAHLCAPAAVTSARTTIATSSRRSKLGACCARSSACSEGCGHNAGCLSTRT